MPELPRVRAAIHEGIAAGLHDGAQLFVSLRGDTHADLALGEQAPGQPLRADDLLVWYSSTKAVTAVAAAQLWERERLHLDQPVAHTLPEFAQGGKDPITPRHLLTHTAGFRGGDADQEGLALTQLPWAEALRRICALPLEPGWVVGQTAGYHPLTSFYVLGELIQRASGEPFPHYVRRHVCEPLGMRDSWVGMPEERFDAYANAGRICPMWRTADASPRVTARSGRSYVVPASPGSSGCGPLRELGRLYLALLHGGELDGQRILEPETVALFTARHRTGAMDKTFQYPMEFGLGFILEPDRPPGPRRGRMPYGYGRHATPATFGHSGMRSSVAFADPTHQLVVALAYNGLPNEMDHQRRVDHTLTTLYEELGLA